MVTFLSNESLTTKLTLIIVGLTAASGLLIPATYASFHPVTTGEIADNSILSVDIRNGQVRTEDIGAGQVRTGDIADNAIQPNITISASSVRIPGRGSAQAHAVCPVEGAVVSGGGYSSGPDFVVYSNRPTSLDTWTVGAINEGFQENVLSAWIVCIGPMP